MSMTGSGLSAVIKSEMETQFGAPDDPSKLQKFCDAMGDAIVEYIQANAVVNVASVSGVTPGGSNSGPGSGTIT